jgi:hypothetical protein
MADEFTREIAGALKQTIDAHGPITAKDVPSATKRLASALRESMKRERDRLATSQSKTRV